MRQSLANFLFGFLPQALPFRFMLSFPVEVMLGKHGRGESFALLGAQWLYVACALLATNLVWRAGLRRYSAYGG